MSGLLYAQSFHSGFEEKKKGRMGLQYVQSFQGLQYGQNFHNRFEERREEEIMESQKIQRFQNRMEGEREKEIVGNMQGLKFFQSFQDRSEEKGKKKTMSSLKDLGKAQSFQERSEKKRMNKIKDLQKAQSFQNRSEEKRKKKTMSLKDLPKAKSFQDLLEVKRRKKIVASLKNLRKARSFPDRRSEVKIKKEMMRTMKDSRKTQNSHDGSDEEEEKMSCLKGSQYALCFHCPFERKRKEAVDGLQDLQFCPCFLFPFEEKKKKETVKGSQNSQRAEEKEKTSGLLGSENALNFYDLPEENLKEQIIGGSKRLHYSQSFQGRSEAKGKKELKFALSFQDQGSSSTIYPAIDANSEQESLETLLCPELQRLQGFENFLSTGWLLQALDLCLSMYRELQDNFPQIRQAVLRQNSKWIDDTLDDTVKLLDVCNALRDKMRDIKHCQEKLHLALHCFNGRLGTWQLVRARKSLGIFNESLAEAQGKSQLENCSSILRRMGEKRAASSAEAGSRLMEPIYAVKDYTVFVCGLLTAAISTNSRRSLPLPCAGQDSDWAYALQTLHFKAKKEMGRRRSKGTGRVSLDELHPVESSCRALYHLLVNTKSVLINEGQDLKLRQSVLCLKNCVAKSEEGISFLENRIDELFKAVVDNRMALLDALTYA